MITDVYSIHPNAGDTIEIEKMETCTVFCDSCKIVVTPIVPRFTTWKVIWANNKGWSGDLIGKPITCPVCGKFMRNIIILYGEEREHSAIVDIPVSYFDLSELYPLEKTNDST